MTKANKSDAFLMDLVVVIGVVKYNGRNQSAELIKLGLIALGVVAH